MKKLFSILIAGIVLSFVMSSCNNKTEDDPGYNPILDSKAHSIAARKAAKIARRQMRDLEAEESIQRDYLDTAETLSFKDDIDRQKKNEEPAVTEKKGDCCPPVVVVVVPQQPCPPAPRRSGGHKKGIKPPCPPCPPAVTPVKPPCTTCGTGKTVYVNGEEYKEYHGEEAPASAPGVAKPGYYFNPLDSMWYKKAN